MSAVPSPLLPPAPQPSGADEGSQHSRLLVGEAESNSRQGPQDLLARKAARTEGKRNSRSTSSPTHKQPNGPSNHEVVNVDAEEDEDQDGSVEEVSSPTGKSTRKSGRTANANQRPTLAVAMDKSSPAGQPGEKGLAATTPLSKGSPHSSTNNDKSNSKDKDAQRQENEANNSGNDGCDKQQQGGGSSGANQKPGGEKRQWRQATLNFGQVVPPSKEHLEEIERLKAVLHEKDAAIAKLEAECKKHEERTASLDSYNENLQRNAAAQNSQIQKYQKVLGEVMQESAMTQRREARRMQHDHHFTLGSAVTLQSATGGSKEMWCEGVFPRDLHRKMGEVQERQRVVDLHRKEAQNKIRNLQRQQTKKESAGEGGEQSNGPQNTSNTLVAADGVNIDIALIEAEEELQVCKQELEALGSLDSDLKAQFKEYESQRTSFIKELTRIREEDSSPFVMTKVIGPEGRYVMMQLLGKGGFSEVWKAFDLQEARVVACKIHRVSRDWSRQTKDHYLKHASRELEIMRKLKHSRLIELYDVFEHDEHTFVSVMEFSAGMDLDTYLKRHRTMRESDARVIMMQLVAALRHLADQDTPIIHYDLKPANILFHSALSTSLDIKITDFGLSKVIATNGDGDTNDPHVELTSVGTGTFYYMPPECFNTSTVQLVSHKVDIWAIGIIFYQMLYGRRPFADGQSQKSVWANNLIVNNAKNGLAFPDRPKVSDEAKELITKCLAYNAVDRPDIQTLSTDVYFRPLKKRNRQQANQPEMPPPQ